MGRLAWTIWVTPFQTQMQLIAHTSHNVNISDVWKRTTITIVVLSYPNAEDVVLYAFVWLQTSGSNCFYSNNCSQNNNIFIVL